jgi:hypothetical protein
MFSKAPVAFLCTLISFDFASLVKGPKAPDLAIFALLSSWVARFVMQPTALHCTSTFGDIIWRIRGVSPPSCTISTLFSATTGQTIYRRVEPRQVTYHSRRDSPARHWLPFVPRYRGSVEERELARGYFDRLPGHL